MQEVNSSESFLEAWPSIIIMTVILQLASQDESFSTYCTRNTLDIFNNSTLITTDQDCVNMIKGSDTLYDRFNGYESKIVSAATFENIRSTFSIYNQTYPPGTCIGRSCEAFDLPTKYCANNPGNNKCSVFGGLGGSTWFFTTYFISIFSAALGITRFLQIGPLSMLNDEGPLRGICTWRFLLAFLAIITSILCKVTLISDFIIPNDARELSELSISIWLERLSTAFAIFVLPNIIFSIICFTYSTGVNRKLIEFILSYPASWILPVATNFAIGPRRSLCKSKKRSQTSTGVFSHLYNS